MLTYGSIVVAGISLLTMWLISRKARSGWLFSILGNAMGAAYDVVTGQPGFLVMSLILLALAARTWRRWGKRVETALPVVTVAEQIEIEAGS